MSSSHNSKEPLSTDIIKDYLLDSERILGESASNPELYKAIASLEETLVSVLYSSSIQDSPLFEDKANPSSSSPGALSSSFQKFREELDLAKAELQMQNTDNIPLPDYLKRYTELNLDKPERKKSLLVRLTQKGIQVLDSLSEGLTFSHNLTLSPELRSAVASSPLTSNDAGFVVFEEKVQDGQKFFYQMVRETPEDVFLSIKIDSPLPQEVYRQVILRRDGRFVLSSKLNMDGVVNFSGLKEGSYSVEFLNETNNKIVDLYLIFD